MFYFTGINRCARGHVDDEVQQLLSSRIGHPHQSAIDLAALNSQVSLYNAEQLGQLSGQLHELQSQDDGSARILEGLSSVQRVLCLKVAAPVMVTYNANVYIANGSRYLI